jgi:hypothetical protein
MSLLDSPRYVAANLFDVLGDVVGAVAVTGVDTVQALPEQPGHPSPADAGPAPRGSPAEVSRSTRRLGDSALAIDSGAGSGGGGLAAEVGGKGLGGVLDQTADALAGLVLGVAEFAAHVIVAVGWPVQNAGHGVSAGGFAPVDRTRIRAFIEPIAPEPDIDPRRGAGLRVVRESGD